VHESSQWLAEIGHNPILLTGSQGAPAPTHTKTRDRYLPGALIGHTRATYQVEILIVPKREPVHEKTLTYESHSSLPVGRCFAGFLWAATLACAAQTQSSTKPDAATPRRRKLAQRKTCRRISQQNWVCGITSAKALTPWRGTKSTGRGARLQFDPRHSEGCSDEMAPREDFGADRRADGERQMWALVNHDRVDPQTAAETGSRAQPLSWNEGWLRSHERILATCLNKDTLTMLTRPAGALRRESTRPELLGGLLARILPSTQAFGRGSRLYE